MPYKLKQEYADMICSDEKLLVEVALSCGRKASSIKRWIDRDSPFLTMVNVLNTIRQYKGLPLSTELTEERQIVA